jgi:hypothetical protein
MKRLLIILGVVLLLAVLAEDGLLGQMQIIHPKCLFHSCVTSTDHPHLKGAKASPGKVDCQGGLLPTNSSGVPHQLLGQPVAPNVQHTLRIIDLCLSGSAGGIPSNSAALFLFFSSQIFKDSPESSTPSHHWLGYLAGSAAGGSDFSPVTPLDRG